MILVCEVCQRENFAVHLSDIAGYSRGELWDAVEIPARKAGWAIRLHPSKSVLRYAVGPECIAKEALQVKVLKPFEDCPCPKCGAAANELVVRYMSGIEIASTISAEHMLRTCKRCGYSFAQRPL
jgi:predicted nucleic-acid-binding Zn-ribbon protein